MHNLSNPDLIIYAFFTKIPVDPHQNKKMSSGILLFWAMFSELRRKFCTCFLGNMLVEYNQTFIRTHIKKLCYRTNILFFECCNLHMNGQIETKSQPEHRMMIFFSEHMGYSLLTWARVSVRSDRQKCNNITYCVTGIWAEVLVVRWCDGKEN